MVEVNESNFPNSRLSSAIKGTELGTSDEKPYSAITEPDGHIAIPVEIENPTSGGATEITLAALKAQVDLIKVQTDKLSFDLASKLNVNPDIAGFSTEVTLGAVKTAVEAGGTEITLAALKAQVDLIKVQTDKLSFDLSSNLNVNSGSGITGFALETTQEDVKTAVESIDTYGATEATLGDVKTAVEAAATETTLGAVKTAVEAAATEATLGDVKTAVEAAATEATLGDVKTAVEAAATEVTLGAIQTAVDAMKLKIDNLTFDLSNNLKVITDTGGVEPMETKIADFNAAAGKNYLVDTSSGVVNVQLWSPLSNGEYFTIKDSGNAGVNKISIVRAGSEKIEDIAADFDLTTAKGSWKFMTDGTDFWLVEEGLKNRIGYGVATEDTVISAGGSGSAAVNALLGNYFEIDFSAGTTVTISNQMQGETLLIACRNTDSVSHNVTMPSAKWQNGTPVVAVPAGHYNVYTVVLINSILYISCVDNLY